MTEPFFLSDQGIKEQLTDLETRMVKAIEATRNLPSDDAHITALERNDILIAYCIAVIDMQTLFTVIVTQIINKLTDLPEHHDDYTHSIYSVEQLIRAQIFQIFDSTKTIDELMVTVKEDADLGKKIMKMVADASEELN